MKTRDFNLTVSSNSLNETLYKKFGEKLDLRNYTNEEILKAFSLLESKLSNLSKNKFNENLENDEFYKFKMMFDVVETAIHERAQLDEGFAKNALAATGRYFGDVGYELGRMGKQAARHTGAGLKMGAKELGRMARDAAIRKLGGTPPDDAPSYPMPTSKKKKPVQKAAESQLSEKHLTPAELKKREEIARAIQKKNPSMDKSRKMAIATSTAKRVAESDISFGDLSHLDIPTKTMLANIYGIADPLRIGTDPRLDRLLIGAVGKGLGLSPADISAGAIANALKLKEENGVVAPATTASGGMTLDPKAWAAMARTADQADDLSLARPTEFDFSTSSNPELSKSLGALATAKRNALLGRPEYSTPYVPGSMRSTDENTVTTKENKMRKMNNEDLGKALGKVGTGALGAGIGALAPMALGALTGNPAATIVAEEYGDLDEASELALESGAAYANAMRRGMLERAKHYKEACKSWGGKIWHDDMGECWMSHAGIGEGKPIKLSMTHKSPTVADEDSTAIVDPTKDPRAGFGGTANYAGATNAPAFDPSGLMKDIGGALQNPWVAGGLGAGAGLLAANLLDKDKDDRETDEGLLGTGLGALGGAALGNMLLPGAGLLGTMGGGALGAMVGDEVVEEGKKSKKAKPDFLDFDKDGNKKEQMKKALKDKQKSPMKETIEASRAKYLKDLIKENVMVKRAVRTLISEGEVGQAEVIMAVKNMVDKFTGWSEDIAQMQAQTAMEMADNIRDEMGNDLGEQFTSMVQPALDAAFQSVKTARETLSNAVAVLSGDATAPYGGIGQQGPVDTTAPAATGTDTGADTGNVELPIDNAEPPEGRMKRESIDRRRRLTRILAGR